MLAEYLREQEVIGGVFGGELHGFREFRLRVFQAIQLEVRLPELAVSERVGRQQLHGLEQELDGIGGAIGLEQERAEIQVRTGCCGIQRQRSAVRFFGIFHFAQRRIRQAQIIRRLCISRLKFQALGEGLDGFLEMFLVEFGASEIESRLSVRRIQFHRFGIRASRRGVIFQQEMIRADRFQIERCGRAVAGGLGVFLDRRFRVSFAEQNVGEQVMRIGGSGLSFQVAAIGGFRVLEFSGIHQRLDFEEFGFRLASGGGNCRGLCEERCAQRDERNCQGRRSQHQLQFR